MKSRESNKGGVTFSFNADKGLLADSVVYKAGTRESSLANNVEEDSSSSGWSTEGSSSNQSTAASTIPETGKKRTKFAGDESSEPDSIFSTHPVTKRRAFRGWLSYYRKRIFRFPFFSGGRICFHHNDSDPTDNYSLREAWKIRKQVEDLVNFESLEIKNMYANILEQRKEVQMSKDHYHFASVDMTQYPKWDANIINRHRATFQIFDVSGDGVIDFEEFSNVLSEFGDKTTPEIRLKYFSKANKTDEFGTIGFQDFLMICHELTEKEIDSPDDQSLVDTFKKIDRNMAIRCGLDVLGQLQGGLF
jgi:Ca2+-binding EF-hand superfamily protein